MRGHDEQTHHMFSYLSPEQRVPADHPLRAVRALTDHALKTMSRRGVVARIVTGPHDATRHDPHLPMRYDTGRPSSVIRLRISQPRTTSLPQLDSGREGHRR